MSYVVKEMTKENTAVSYITNEKDIHPSLYINSQCQSQPNYILRKVFLSIIIKSLFKI